MTGWSGKILRIDLDPGSPIFCLTEYRFSLKSTISDILGFSIEAMGTTWDPMRPHGTPWDPMGPHGTPWDPMGPHGNPWEPMGTHGNPWEPMGTHGFSMNFRGGRGSGRQKNVGGGGGGGSPPHESLDRAL